MPLNFSKGVPHNGIIIQRGP